MKAVFNRKGSTLLMVLIMTAVLTILGTALISMTFMNFNMKYNNDRSKKAMYFSESGIDQVYAYVGYSIEKTLEDSRSMTDTFREQLINHLETTLVPVSELIPAPYPGEVHADAPFLVPLGGMTNEAFLEELGLKDVSGYKKLYIPDGYIEPTATPAATIEPTSTPAATEAPAAPLTYDNKILDTDLLMEVLDNYYRLAFMDLYDINYSNIDTTIQNDLNGITYNGNVCDITVTGGITSFASLDSEHFIIKGVHSEFNYEGKVTKAVTTNIVVKAPENLYPFITVEDVLLVENNPIWQNALVANDDIIFVGDTNKEVEVYGDVYALGTKGDNGTLTHEGIALENGANVNVAGDLVTMKNIQTTSEDDLLSVCYGLLYCESLITQTNAENSSILVDNVNVYTKDDIEINAEKSDIAISNGSYYGFSDGVEVSSSHDNSSAVIINVPLYKDGDPTDSNKPATLTIDGVDPILDPQDDPIPNDLNYYRPKQNSNDEGVWVMGTAYADFVGDPADGNPQLWPYQTGESVSMKGNYVAYTLPLDIPSESPESLLKLDSTNATISRASKGPIYNEDLSLFLATGSTLDGQNYHSADKKNYFMQAYYQYPALFDYDTTDSLLIDNYQYVVGAKYMLNGSIDGDSSTGIIRYQSLRDEISHEYKYYLQNTTNYTDSTYPLDDTDPRYIEDIADDYDVLFERMDYSTSGVLTAEVGGKNEVVEYLFQKDGISGIERATKILYVSHVSPSVNRNYRLVGDGAGVNPGGYTDIVTQTGLTPEETGTPGYFQGIIITQGDVLIDGDVNFVGTIIAGGSIKIINGHDKSEFHNSDPESVEFMAELIRDNPSLRTMLKKGIIGDPIQFIRQDVVRSSVDESGTDISNVKNTYKRLIDFEFWRLN